MKHAELVATLGAIWELRQAVSELTSLVIGTAYLREMQKPPVKITWRELKPEFEGRSWLG